MISKIILISGSSGSQHQIQNRFWKRKWTTPVQFGFNKILNGSRYMAHYMGSMLYGP